jgi:hypothetical protein
VITNVCNALALTNLRMLIVDVCVPVSKAAWLKAFGHSTSLQMVRVQVWPAFGLVSALSTRLDENPAEEDLSGEFAGKVVFPNLRLLYLDEPIGYRFNEKEFLEILRDCLMRRRHWNVVRLLCLECTNEQYDQVELLREIVNVDWRVADPLDDGEDEWA